MNKPRKMKVKIAGEIFKVTTVMSDQNIIDRDGDVTRNVSMTFDPKDAERLSKVMGGIKPGEFSIGFNPSDGETS